MCPTKLFRSRSRSRYRSKLHLIISIVVDLIVMPQPLNSAKFKNTSEIIGCTAPYLLPDKPFVVVWNHPTHTCASHGVDLDLSKWGVADNKEDSFIGDEISLLYRPGKWPYYMDKKAYNGGIPQTSNLSLHIASLKGTLDSQLPSVDFSGLGVIDFEKWRPLYYLNFDNLKIYQEKSLELAKEKYPNYNQSQLLDEAIKEFETAAKSFILESLQTASEFRPYGQWGYYGYPRCWDTTCNGSTVTINDRLHWVFSASGSLYPSIYFDLAVSPSDRAKLVTQRLLETIRVRAKWAAPNAAIFPYAQIQDGPYDMFNETDLYYSVRLVADLGASGVLLWGSSENMRAKSECLILKDYINSTLGPFCKKVMDFFSDCASHLCSGHGRCVRKDFEAANQRHLNTAKHRYHNCEMPKGMLRMKDEEILNAESFESKFDFNDYVCRCLAGWSGPHCKVK